MKKSFILLFFLLFIFTIMAVGCATYQKVNISEKAGIGKYLTDNKGMTLYWFQKDSSGKSACVGECVVKWPIFYAEEKISPPPGVKDEDFGVITREDGKKQTTFRGYPLYYWFQDKVPGDTKGHKVNNVWFVIDPSNFPPK